MFELFLILMGLIFTTDDVFSKPHWLDNTIGKEDIVLPGYDSITSIKDGVKIGVREYDFSGKGYINNIKVADEVLLTGMYLEFFIDGEKYIGTLNKPQFKIIKNSHAVFDNEIIINKDITVILTSRIEYDGVVIVDALVKSLKPVKIDKLNIVTKIKSNSSSVVMGYKAKGIRKQKLRNDVIKKTYKGEFLNVVSVANGDSSFWWFADNAKGWIWNDDYVTKIERDINEIKIIQKVIGSSYILPKNFAFKFNYLVTPIKKIDTDFRNKRIMWGVPSKKQQKIKSAFKIWWTTGFSYDAFPYTDYPGNTKEKLGNKDLSFYKGRAYNKKLISNDKAKWDVSWIPYFSAHVISELDPVLAKYKEQWQIKPIKIFKDGLNPYSNQFNKPVLTHRADGYSDYILWRISEEIDNLDMEGIYLDHGPPHDSSNMLNGGWYDSNGNLQPSLDILALRSFLKRLRVLFHVKEKPGYVFVHNSNREIIPAYGFTYGTIDGEQYRRSLVNGNYLDIIDVSEFRARFSNKQYGVVNYWLPVEWANHKKGDGWINSPEQIDAYRKSMALALLHDVPIWPQGVNLSEQSKVLKIIDNFGIKNAIFKGYWNSSIGLKYKSKDFLISEYKLDSKSLYVLSNVSSNIISASLDYNNMKLDSIDGKNINSDTIEIKINPGDFSLVIMKNIRN